MIYYINKCWKVASTYLDCIQIEKCDVEIIASALRAFLAPNKFYVKNLIGIGTDNTSVLVGINDGVHTK